MIPCRKQLDLEIIYKLLLVISMALQTALQLPSSVFLYIISLQANVDCKTVIGKSLKNHSIQLESRFVSNLNPLFKISLHILLFGKTWKNCCNFFQNLPSAFLQPFKVPQSELLYRSSGLEKLQTWFKAGHLNLIQGPAALYQTG